VLLAAGRLISGSRIRVRDVLGTQALARVPTVVTACIALLPGAHRYASRMAAQLTGRGEAGPAAATDAAAYAVLIGVSIAMVVWMVALMYRAFCVSCNVSGRKAVVAFIVALMVAEVVSKVAIVGLARLAAGAGPDDVARVLYEPGLCAVSLAPWPG